MKENLQDALKEVMRIYPQGVTVLTTNGTEGPRGITIGSFTSVSLDPPLVMISIAKGSALHDTFATAARFAISFLASDQRSISVRFAGRSGEGKKFEGLRYMAGSTGCPIIAGARASVECSAWRVYEGGDHSIIVGKVVAAKVLNAKRPLVYYSKKYTTTDAAEYPTHQSRRHRTQAS